MKNKILLFLSILVLTINANAQNIPNNYRATPQDTISLYQQNTDSLFRYLLDKSPITTGFLEEYGCPVQYRKKRCLYK